MSPKENISQLSPKVKNFVEEKAKVCQPKDIHICDGSEAENKYLLNLMQKQGMIEPLTKYENWYTFSKIYFRHYLGTNGLYQLVG